MNMFLCLLHHYNMFYATYSSSHFFLMNEYDKIKQDQSCIQRHRSSNKCLKCKYVQQFALEKPLFFCILSEIVVL